MKIIFRSLLALGFCSVASFGQDELVDLTISPFLGTPESITSTGDPVGVESKPFIAIELPSGFNPSQAANNGWIVGRKDGKWHRYQYGNLEELSGSGVPGTIRILSNGYVYIEAGPVWTNKSSSPLILESNIIHMNSRFSQMRSTGFSSFSSGIDTLVSGIDFARPGGGVERIFSRVSVFDFFREVPITDFESGFEPRYLNDVDDYVGSMRISEDFPREADASFEHTADFPDSSSIPTFLTRGRNMTGQRLDGTYYVSIYGADAADAIGTTHYVTDSVDGRIWTGGVLDLFYRSSTLEHDRWTRYDFREIVGEDAFDIKFGPMSNSGIIPGNYSLDPETPNLKTWFAVIPASLDLDTRSYAGQRPTAVLSAADGVIPSDAQVKFHVFRETPSSPPSEIGSVIVDWNPITSSAVGQIDTSLSDSSPGDIYSVEASILVRGGEARLKGRSNDCVVLPGVPASIVVSEPGEPIVRDGLSAANVTVTVRDEFGNNVEDGTFLDVFASSGTGGFAGTIVAEIVDGEASVDLTAGRKEDVEYSFRSGPLTIQGFLSADDFDAELLVSRDRLDASMAETTPVILSTNASDGTKVVWNVSIPGLGSPQQTVGTVEGGLTSIVVSSEDASHLGRCVVSATIAESKVISTEVEFFSSTAFYTVPRVPAIVGDRVGDGIHEQDWNRIDEDGNPVVETTSGYAYTQTPVDIIGEPLTRYRVYLRYAEDYELLKLEADDIIEIEMDPVSDLPILVLETNSEGSVDFVISSLGTFERDIATESFIDRCSYRVEEWTIGYVPPVWPRDLEPAPGEDPFALPPGTGRLEDFVTITTYSGWAIAWDSFGAFFGADPDTPSGIGASVVGGMLIVGDVGSLIKNTWRSTPLSSGEPDGTEVFFATLGLGTELAVVAGEVADAPISLVKALRARFGKSAFTDILAGLVGRAVENATDLAKLGFYARELLLRPRFAEISNEIFTSEAALKSVIEAVNEVGESYARAYDELIEAGVDISATGARLNANFFDQLAKADPASASGLLYASIKSSPDAAKHVKSLQAIFEAGISPDVVTKTLNTFGPGSKTFSVSTSYSGLDIIDGLAVAARKMDTDVKVEVYDSFIRSLAADNSGKFGRLYELQVFLELLNRNPDASSFALSQVLKDVTTSRTLTDFDVVVDDVFYQVKRSNSAAQNLDRIIRWVNLTFGEVENYDKIKFVIPSRSDLPTRVKNYLEDLGIEIIEGIPFVQVFGSPDVFGKLPNCFMA